MRTRRLQQPRLLPAPESTRGTQTIFVILKTKFKSCPFCYQRLVVSFIPSLVSLLAVSFVIVWLALPDDVGVDPFETHYKSHFPRPPLCAVLLYAMTILHLTSLLLFHSKAF